MILEMKYETFKLLTAAYLMQSTEFINGYGEDAVTHD